jgi:hypothetical protein
LVTVPAVQRVHPRHWDGHRLLQFLTGLALVTLAFGTPAASTAPASAATPTVEAPAAAASLAEAPAVTAGSAVRDRAAAVAAPAARAVAAGAAQAVAAPAAQGAPARTSARSDECRHDASRTAHAAPPAADAATLAGITQPAHGSRAPPVR